ncbi:pfs domain-containing protein, partial [Aureobasidium melanogenum]
MSVTQASTPPTRKEFSSEDYTIGIICALPTELAAATEMLDDEYPRLPQKPGDNNYYEYGRIGGHNVVIGTLPSGSSGLVSAAGVALNMKSSFRNIRMGLMVGIGGGVPSNEHDVRLGDVVVSKPTGQHGGVVQYDIGKTLPNGVFERTRSLNRPPTALLTTLTGISALEKRNKLKVADRLTQLAVNLPDYAFPSELTDDLQLPVIHYGTIASGNQVMKDAVERDKTSQDLGGVLCFEMEAAGLMDEFPCLVIRGISDYSDSHKNDGWQDYAAATAAAFVKELLNHLAPMEVEQTQTLSEAMSNLSLQLAKNTTIAQQTEEKIDCAREREPLYFASLLGLKSSVVQLWQDCSQLDDNKGFYGNALEAAACMGHDDIVMWLTDQIDNPPDYFNLSRIVRYLQSNVAQTLRALFRRRHGRRRSIIDAHVMCHMRMNHVGQEILRICLEENLAWIPITKELIIAKPHKTCTWNRKLVDILIEYRVHKFPLDFWTLFAIAERSRTALPILVNSRKEDIKFLFSDYLVLAEAESTYAIRELLNIGVSMPVTSELVSILARSALGSEILKLLLDTQTVQQPLTKSDVLTVAKGFRLETFESLLRHDWEDSSLTEELVLAIAANCYFEYRVREYPHDKQSLDIADE